jgi:hypothetical protein
MTSSDRWLSHYSFRLRNLTEDSPEEGLDGSFHRLAQALARYETPITFQVQLLDGEKYLSWCLELTPNGSTVQAEKRDHPDKALSFGREVRPRLLTVSKSPCCVKP